jgi:phospholipid-binding lipoprotein MlaA
MLSDEHAPETEPPEQGGEIVVTAPSTASRTDPLQTLNIQSFELVSSIDGAITGPISHAYRSSVPAPVRSGVRNALGNLQEPVVALNYLFQLKPGKSMETVGRFAINSTIGVAGLVDVAKRRPFRLPRRSNGFGNTLGFYGVKPGAYLYLPLIGSTTVRDLGGRLLDLSVLPTVAGAPFNDPVFVLPTSTVRLLDERAEGDEEIRRVREGASDPYSLVRARYLSARQNEIDALRGGDSARASVSSSVVEP